MALGKKTGGRVKGTPNKITTEVKRIFEQERFNPIRRSIEVCKTTENEAIRAALLKELMKYFAPQLKAIEVSGNPDQPLYVADPDARQRRIDELLSKRTSVPPLSVVD